MSMNYGEVLNQENFFWYREKFNYWLTIKKINFLIIFVFVNFKNK